MACHFANSSFPLQDVPSPQARSCPVAFGLKGHFEHPSAAAELDTHTHMRGINLLKSSPRKQVLVLEGLWTSCCVPRPASVVAAGQKSISIHSWSQPGAAGARAQLGAAKVQPTADSAQQLHFPAAGPTAWLTAIYTSLHGHFTAQKGLVEKRRK